MQCAEEIDLHRKTQQKREGYLAASIAACAVGVVGGRDCVNGIKGFKGSKASKKSESRKLARTHNLMLLLRPTDPCHCHILTSCTNSYTATNLSSSIKIIPSHHERHRSLFSHATGPTAGSPLNSSRRRGNTPHLQSITVSTFGGIGTCPCSSSRSLLATLQRLPV